MARKAKAIAVTEVYQVSEWRITVTATEDGKASSLIVTNPDNSEIEVGFVAGATAGATRDAIDDAFDNNAAIQEKYASTDNSTAGVDLTQLLAEGAFSIRGTNLGGTTLTIAEVISPSKSPPQYKIDLYEPVAGSAGDVYVSRDTLRGGVGAYTLAANAVTTKGAASITVDDDNGKLAPARGAQAKFDESGFIFESTDDQSTIPEWAIGWLASIQDGSNPTTVADSDYTILATDSVVYLSATTSAGDYDLTFAGGRDGQEVTCICTAIGGSDEFTILGIEGLTDNLAAANDAFTARYNATADKWYIIANSIAA